MVKVTESGENRLSSLSTVFMHSLTSITFVVSEKNPIIKVFDNWRSPDTSGLTKTIWIITLQYTLVSHKSYCAWSFQCVATIQYIDYSGQDSKKHNIQSMSLTHLWPGNSCLLFWALTTTKDYIRHQDWKSTSTRFLAILRTSHLTLTTFSFYNTVKIFHMNFFFYQLCQNTSHKLCFILYITNQSLSRNKNLETRSSRPQAGLLSWSLKNLASYV